MFRMEFRPHGTEEEEDDDVSRHSITESVYQCAIFEGRVGRFGKVYRVSHSNLHGNSFREAEHRDKGVTPDVTPQQAAISLDAQVLRELVRSFGALQHGSAVNLRGESSSLSPSSNSRGFSMRSESSSFRSDMSSPSEGSVADLKAFQREGRPWEEPLLALQQQQNEVFAAETRRRDEEQILEVDTPQRELRDLANCVEFPPSHGSFKKTKLQKVSHKTGVAAAYRFFKRHFGLCFQSPRIHNRYAAREAMTPRRVVHEDYLSRNVAILQMRAASRRPARSAIEFPTVISTQRDVPAWTLDEYMRKNGKAHQGKHRKKGEDFGGIEGNHLMNPNIDDGARVAYDSDSSD